MPRIKQNQVLPEQRAITHIINATGSAGVVLQGLATYIGKATIYDCCGEQLSECTLNGNDVQVFDLPQSGRMCIHK